MNQLYALFQEEAGYSLPWELFVKQIEGLMQINQPKKVFVPHKTTTLYHNGQGIDIDENIAPMIELLWGLGINTMMSCENNIPLEYIWIQFEKAADYAFFMDIIRPRLSPSQLERVFPKLIKGPVPNQWFHSQTYENIAPNFSSYWIRFPGSDYSFVMEKLRNK